MKKLLITTLLAASAVLAQAADYKIDTAGAHAFINFKIQHLGYSWLTGRFNAFDGNFTYDAKKPNDSKIKVVIQTNSIDSNHAERDKHLKGKDFLDVHKYPTATFESTSYVAKNATQGTLSGTFTFHGVTKAISFPITKVGEGKDPWGGYRAGFAGTTKIRLGDYGIKEILGPKSTEVELQLLIEGIRQ